MIKRYEKTVPAVDDFFAEALKILHEKAVEYGWTINGMVYAKELLPYGQTFLLQMLNDKSFQQKFGLDAVSYYFNIGCYVFCGGVFYADCWVKDTAILRADDKLQYLTENDPYDLAVEILSIKNSSAFEDFLSRIFDDWLEIMDPYWDMSNSRDYIFQGLLIFYQLGISERLKKLGIKNSI